MSSILKALKRLEQEKAARKPDSFRVDAEILKGGTSRRTSPVAVFLVVLVIFVCGGSATYFFMKKPSVSAPPHLPPTTDPKARLEAPALPESMPVQPAVQATDAVKTLPRPAAEKPVPQLKPAVSRPQAQVGKPSGTPPQAVLPEAKPETQPAVPVPAGKPLLRVDGIAFQDNSVDSFAMVNGVTVSKGSVIEGVRVEEIQKDRVKFSRGGEKFEVFLEKSN